MPTLTRYFIKTSLVFFVLGLAAALLLALPGGTFQSLSLFPVYIHLLTVGWITLLIIGVAYWMFPKYTREQPRRSEALAWASYFLLTGGLALRVVSEPLNAIAAGPRTVWGWLMAGSALLLWLGGLAFVVNTWGRVKEK